MLAPFQLDLNACSDSGFEWLGIEIGTNKLPLDVISEVCGQSVANVSTFLVSENRVTAVRSFDD